MSWSNLKLADVVLETPPEPQAGRYVFQLVPGAQYRERNGYTEINASAAIVKDTTGGNSFAGKRVFFSYPDPEAISPKTGKPMSWSAQALKKLELAIGIDALPGEDPVAYLNRAAGTNPTFSAAIISRIYETDGQQKSALDFKHFSVAPAV